MALLNPVIAEIGVVPLIILGVIGILIFGRRLPEVGRSLGKGIVEFKKGLTGVEDDVTKAGEKKLEDTKPSPSEVERLRIANEQLLKSNEALIKSNEQLRTSPPNPNNG